MLSMQQASKAFTATGAEHVHVTDRAGLSATHLRDLANARSRVIHVKQFVNHSACAILATGALDLGYRPYINVDRVRRIGMAYYETEHQPPLIEEYFRVAAPMQEQMRKACEPVGSPLDTLRCRLDELWPAGAQLQTLFGRKMFVGLSRMVEPGTTFLAHHDIFSDDAPGMPESESLKAQFGANIYVQMPERGGELLMWHRNLGKQEFDERRRGEYGIEIGELPPPDLVLKPGTGDLLIFDARKVHAVASPQDDSRLAFSCFIGYRGDDQPLTFWS